MMGQLEKYGLYVLCLVIFLMLGVALWGDPVAAAPRRMEGSETRMAQVQPSFDLNDFSKELSAREPADQPKQGSNFSLDLGDAGSKTPVKEPAPMPEPTPEPKVKTAPVVDEPVAQPARRATYKVKQGDSLSTIASQQVGSVRMLPLLLKVNPGVVPERLQPGQELALPTAQEVADSGLAKAAAKAAPKADAGPSGSGATRTYTIVRGDTLEDLALRMLGSRRRVEEIKGLNPTVDPTRLRIGQKILLPND
jgi:LysM repeat protein